jgi:hypothetical protein
METIVCLIKFFRSIEELNDDFDNLSEFDKGYIYDLNADSFFDYEDENSNYVTYVIAKSSEIARYISILKKYRIKYESTDLSLGILKHEVDLTYLSNHIDVINLLKYEFFMDELDYWILENLEIDIVLDRIVEVGIEKLTDVEKRFLEKYEK